MLSADKLLRFKIGLTTPNSNTMIGYQIYVDDTRYHNNIIIGGKNIYLKFNLSVTTPNSYLLRILSNRLPNESGSLSITSIKIEDIEMKNLIWTNSICKYNESILNANNNRVYSLKKCHVLCVDGTYEFPFTTPYYDWLISNWF